MTVCPYCQRFYLDSRWGWMWHTQIHGCPLEPREED